MSLPEKMPGTGVEPPSFKPQKPIKTKDSEGRNAKSGAPEDRNYSDLAEIVAVWPELSEHIKSAIKALVQTQNKP